MTQHNNPTPTTAPMTMPAMAPDPKEDELLELASATPVELCCGGLDVASPPCDVTEAVDGVDVAGVDVAGADVTGVDELGAAVDDDLTTVDDAAGAVDDDEDGGGGATYAPEVPCKP